MGDSEELCNEPCPLCGTAPSRLFAADRRRRYWRCSCCALVFVGRNDLPTPTEEKAIYDLHENSPADAGYRCFLQRLLDPLCQRLPLGAHGLDFGCGPGPTLSVMAGERGLTMALYDPFYAPDRAVLACNYDFITATEVVEHLHQPGFELDRVWRSLKPGGILGLMTKLVIDPQAFGRWHYKNDPTHVRFFSRETFAWLARHWQARLEIVGADVILLEKSDAVDAGPLTMEEEP